MLSFDAPYEGKVSQKKDNNSTILMLERLKVETSIIEKIDSTVIQNIQIIPYNTHTFVKVAGSNPFTLQASKTVDNSGLRIRAKTVAPIPTATKALITKKEQDISNSFLKVLAVLAFLFLVLYLLKKWLTQPKTSSNSWLFHKNDAPKQEIKIIQQKMIDTKNRVVLLEFNTTRYLVIIGHSNLILDKYKHEQTDNQENFETLLIQNDEKLEALLKDTK